MFVTFHDLTIAECKLDEYVAARRRLANPPMVATRGFRDTVLLRSRNAEGEERLLSCVLLNMWDDRDTQQTFGASNTHDEFLAVAKPLVRSWSWRTYEHIDDVSIEVGRPESVGTFVVGRYRCHPGRRADYLAARRDLVNPNIRRAPGFAGVSVLAEADDGDAFVVVNRWAKDEAIVAYSATPERKSAVATIRGLVAPHPATCATTSSPKTRVSHGVHVEMRSAGD